MVQNNSVEFPDIYTFSFYIYYVGRRSDCPHATIQNIRTDSSLTGTEVVLLIHHILKRIGIKTCSLLNRAQFAYHYYSQRHMSILRDSMPLIHLRCICGKSTDWYSNFGYHNGISNMERIAEEMKRIHDIRTKSCSLGPMLFELWMQKNKTEFHRVYTHFEDEFVSLTALRDCDEWMVYFE